MKAKAAMPERVSSNEGLGLIVEVKPRMAGMTHSDKLKEELVADVLVS
jgi:hypothetical protein